MAKRKVETVAPDATEKMEILTQAFANNGTPLQEDGSIQMPEPEAVAPVEEKDEILEQMIAKYGKAFKLVADLNGKEVVGYYRYPDYKVKKEVGIKTFFEGDQIGAAEIILAKCWTGAGEHLYQYEDIRFECAISILFNVPDAFNNVSLKKTLMTNESGDLNASVTPTR